MVEFNSSRGIAVIRARNFECVCGKESLTPNIELSYFGDSLSLA